MGSKIMEQYPTHVEALSKTRKAVGITYEDLAKLAETTTTNLSNTIGKNPSYLPSLALIERILAAFEATKPGARLYYSLILSGYSLEQAAKISFSSDNATPKLDPKEVANLKQESQMRQLVVSLIDKIDLRKLIVDDLDSKTAISILISCLDRKNFFDSLKKHRVAYQIAEKIVYCGFDLGARSFQIGKNLDPEKVAGIMKGFSPRIASIEQKKPKKQSQVETSPEELELIG
jgi:transcriptional regulator with XRE-family HTH domain